MTWTQLAPVAAKAIEGTAASAVTLTVNPTGQSARQTRQRGLLLVRPHLIEGRLPFWRPGLYVIVHLGAGEHAGMLRIVPGRSHLLRKAVGKGIPDTTATLAIHGLRNMPVEGMAAVGLEFDYHDDWLEVTLPPWAKPSPAVAITANVPQPPKRAPFRGVAATQGLPQTVGRPSTPVR